MKRVVLGLSFLFCLVAVAPTLAQNPNYDAGPVWRVTYYHVKPGMGDAFWKDFHDHLKPLLEEYKKQGWITDYKTFTNPTTDSPMDWDTAIAILFPNWAAFDQLDAKATTVVTKHYGSREASSEAARKRSEFRDVVSSKLAREVMTKELASQRIHPGEATSRQRPLLVFWEGLRRRPPRPLRPSPGS